MRQIFEQVERCCLIGHTHVQGVFTDEPNFTPPPQIENRYEFNDREKTVINVGSAGQPRDRDPRSGYTLIHDGYAEFVRIAYDVKAVIRKIEQIPELHDFFGQRLIDGR